MTANPSNPLTLGLGDVYRNLPQNYPWLQRSDANRIIINLVPQTGIEPVLTLRRTGFSYHYSFHYQHKCCLWSGLYLHHIFRFRCFVSSLYTFLISKAWLGITILQASPNLRNSTLKISLQALNFFVSYI